MHQIKNTEQRWEAYQTTDAELIMVAYGISSRIARRGVQIGRDQGIKLGLIRPQTLWPFPRKAFQRQGCQVKAYMTVEISMLAQMKEDVSYACRQKHPVHSFTTACEIPDPTDIVNKARAVLEGEIKEMEAL
jgi:pyruvate/2-oxoacid:ferredoxin oxidoreductase alpha subunit